MLLIGKIGAQNITYLENLKKEYKGDNIVILKDYDKITINIKKGKLVILREVYSRNFYTNNKAQIYAKDQVVSSNFRILKKIEAYTEVKKKGKYKKIKVKEIKENKYIDNNVFYQDTKTHDFVFPSLREDAISNLRYIYQQKEPHLLNENFFQSNFPIEDLEMIIDVDENVNMGFVKFNFDSIDYDSTFEHKKHRKIYTFRAKKIKKIEFKRYPPPVRYVIPHLVPYIKSYKVNGETKNVLRNTQDLYNWYHSLLTNVACNDIEELKKEAIKIAAPFKTEEEKTKAIFKWVQKNIKYIAVEVGIGGFIPDCASNVYKNKYGDCKGMANILYHMLKAVNIKSYLTWVGTVDLPYSYEQIPTPMVDNHMILTYIDKNGKYNFLDATDENVTFGMPSSFIQGKEALIGKGENYEIKNIPIIPAEKNLKSDSIYLSIDNDVLKGTGNITYTGYYYVNIRRQINNIFDQKKQNKFLNRYLDRGNNKFLVKKSTIKTNEDKGIVNLQYDFTIGSYISKTKDQIFINMNIFKGILVNKIKKDRVYPMRFAMKNTYQYYIKLEIPKGYLIDHIPNNVNFANKIYKFNIQYQSQKNNYLIYNLYVQYNTMQLNKKDFELYNELTKTINNNFREVVILKKE